MVKTLEATSSATAMRPDWATTCTLETYAHYKSLPIDFLRQLGLCTIDNPYRPGRPALAIPYCNPDGSLHRFRIRTALLKSQDGSDQRMLWDRQPDGRRHRSIHCFRISPNWMRGPKLYGPDYLMAFDIAPTARSSSRRGPMVKVTRHGRRDGRPQRPVRQPCDMPRTLSCPRRGAGCKGGRALIKRLSRSEHRDRIRVGRSLDVARISRREHSHAAELCSTAWIASRPPPVHFFLRRARAMCTSSVSMKVTISRPAR